MTVNQFPEQAHWNKPVIPDQSIMWAEKAHCQKKAVFIFFVIVCCLVINGLLWAMEQEKNLTFFFLKKDTS